MARVCRVRLEISEVAARGKIYVSACYASQQAAEKAFKALLLENGKIPPKIHSLDRLITVLKSIKIDISKIESDARKLDTYYITTRYPGQYGGPEGLYGQEDATRAITSAENILTFVKPSTIISNTKEVYGCN